MENRNEDHRKTARQNIVCGIPTESNLTSQSLERDFMDEENESKFDSRLVVFETSMNVYSEQYRKKSYYNGSFIHWWYRKGSLWVRVLCISLPNRLGPHHVSIELDSFLTMIVPWECGYQWAWIVFSCLLQKTNAALKWMVVFLSPKVCSGCSVGIEKENCSYRMRDK